MASQKLSMSGLPTSLGTMLPWEYGKDQPKLSWVYGKEKRKKPKKKKGEEKPKLPWEYGKDLFACFVDLEKAYDRVPRDKLWKVLQEYGVNGQLLRAIKSFYCRPEVCVRVNGKQSKPFHVGVGLRQGCVLSPLLFIVYMNWIDKCSQADECATIGNCKISRLLFADDLVLLSSTESGLQRALNSFADACNTAGMKISTAKTEVLHLSRNPA